MGERGENFAALVKTLSEDPATKNAYLDWLRELRPEELDDVATLRVRSANRSSCCARRDGSFPRRC